MKNIFFLLILFSFLGCLPEADISISKVSDLPNSNTNGKTILTFKYTSKGSGALVADQIEVGTTVNFTPTTTGGAPTSFSITPALPTGFSFNTSDGTISGSATGYFAPTLFTVTATNDFGSIDQNVTLGSSYGSFALLPTVDSVSSIYGNKNVALGVKVEFDVSSGVAGTYSCKIETITGDDLTTLTGISYNSTNCKIESTAIPTIYFPHHTTFVATVTRTEDLVTAGSSLSIQIFNNPVISSFIIENGQGPNGVLDSRGGTISVTGVNFEVGDEFYDSTNPSNEIFLNGTSCTSLVSSTSTKCLLSEITPGRRKFKIKRLTGISNEMDLDVYNTAPTIEVITPGTFPTKGQKAFGYDAFPFDTRIDFKISTGPTETERNAESAVISLTTDIYSAPRTFIDWDLTHCTESNIAGGSKKLSCTLKPSGERAYGLVNLKVTAYETMDPLKTSSIDGDFVRYPLNLKTQPSGTPTYKIDPFSRFIFDFQIASIDQFKNFLEITGGYSPFLIDEQFNPLRNGAHVFTFDDLDFSAVDTTFTDFLDSHHEASSNLRGKLTGDCSKNSTITAFPLSSSGRIVSWFDSFRGSITCLTFDRIRWDLGNYPEISDNGLIATTAILENEESNISLTDSFINFNEVNVNSTGILFGSLDLVNNLKINSGLLKEGVLNVNLRNSLNGSGTWNTVGMIAGQIAGSGKVYGTFGGTIIKSGGSSSIEKFGLIAGLLGSGFGISTNESFIRGELNLKDTNLFDSHGSVGVIAGMGTEAEVLNTQIVSTIYSSMKNGNEAGIFGTGSNIFITDVVNDVHFINNGLPGEVKGAGLIGTKTDEVVIRGYNSVVMVTDQDKAVNLPLEGGILFSNCNADIVRLNRTYLVTPSMGYKALTLSNNCSFYSSPEDFIVSGTTVLSRLEGTPIPGTLAWTTTTLNLTDRSSYVPSWLTNCVSSTPDTGGDKLVGFCLGQRKIVPEYGSFTESFPMFIHHFSDFLALPASNYFINGGYFVMGNSINLEGFTNLFFSSMNEQPLSFHLNGNLHDLRLPSGNMPFFTGTVQDSEFINMKIYKKTHTGITDEHWTTTDPDFYNGHGRSLIFYTLDHSYFRGEINFDINYFTSLMNWSGTSLFGYNLKNSTFEVDIKGNFSVTGSSTPASYPLLRFSGFYKAAESSLLSIQHNSLALNLDVTTDDCADNTAGILGKWGFETTDSSPTVLSEAFSGSSNLSVQYLGCSGVKENLCFIEALDNSGELSCDPTEFR